MSDQYLEILDRIHHLSDDEHEEDLKILKQEYNQIISRLYNDTSGLSYDIMEILPPEVWIQVIQDSLPLYGYAPALLILTLVSKKWRTALISTPILWAHIQIRGTSEDSLAIIETFRQLSRDTPLLLTIYAPIKYDSPVIGSILSTIGPRIQKVAVVHDINPLAMGSAAIIEMCTALSTILEFPQHLMGVVDIHLKHNYDVPIHSRTVAPLLMKANLPPGLRTIRGWCFHHEEISALQASMQYFDELHSCVAMDSLVNSFDIVSQLKTIVTSRSEHPTLDIQSGDPSKFSSLTSLYYSNYYRAMLVELLGTVGSQLVELNLTIPMSKLSNIQPTLRTMNKLKELTFNIIANDPWDEGAHSLGTIIGLPDSTSQVSSLRSLSLDAHTLTHIRTEPEVRIFRDLIATFAILYQEVEDVSFQFAEPRVLVPDVMAYVGELPKLRRLCMDAGRGGITSDLTKTALKSLEELDTGGSDGLLYYPSMPLTLSLLKLKWEDYCKGGGSLAQINCDKLFIILDYYDDSTVELPFDSFPSLISLSVFFPQFGRLHLNSFPFLTTLSLQADVNGLQATELCFSILYYPDTCPSLNEIKFLGCAPEWDILFLMLETRNFLPEPNISRIRKLTLPYIWDELRGKLVSLLRGLFTERLSNEDMSFEPSKELIFNADL